MTVSQLYSSVARLGFETSLEDNDLFFQAANRAILQVNAIRPMQGIYVINHKPLDNLIRNASFSPIEVEGELCFEAAGAKAYYFEADGEGIAHIETFNDISRAWETVGRIEFSANRTFVPHKGMIKKNEKFIQGQVRLHFVGDYLYSVRNVALYRSLYSADENSIPAYEAFTRYDISTLVTDFATLASPPIKEDSEHLLLNQGYEIENDRVILLPYHARGFYKIAYKRKPAVLEYTDDPLEDQTRIDLDEELCALLPMLVASYVWADDEPEKAQYYLTLYRERAIDIERRHKDLTPAVIKSSNDW